MELLDDVTSLRLRQSFKSGRQGKGVKKMFITAADVIIESCQKVFGALTLKGDFVIGGRLALRGSK